MTRHGQTIGFYIPVPKQPANPKRDAMRKRERMQEELARLGISEDELVADFEGWGCGIDASR